MDRYLPGVVPSRQITVRHLLSHRSGLHESPFGFGNYGLGLWIWDMSCGKAIGHSGHIEGFDVVAWSMSDRHRSVVAVVNSDNRTMVDNLAEQALCG